MAISDPLLIANVLTCNAMEEKRRCRHQGNTGSSSDLMNPLNPISPIYAGNDYSNSDSCTGGYDSGGSSDSAGS